MSLPNSQNNHQLCSQSNLVDIISSSKSFCEEDSWSVLLFLGTVGGSGSNSPHNWFAQRFITLKDFETNCASWISRLRASRTATQPGTGTKPLGEVEVLKCIRTTTKHTKPSLHKTLCFHWRVLSCIWITISVVDPVALSCYWHVPAWPKNTQWPSLLSEKRESGQTHLFHWLKKIVKGPKSRNLKVQMHVSCRENKAACEIVKNTHSITMYIWLCEAPRLGRMMSWLHEAPEIRWDDVMVTWGVRDQVGRHHGYVAQISFISRKESSQSISQFWSASESTAHFS